MIRKLILSACNVFTDKYFSNTRWHVSMPSMWNVVTLARANWASPQDGMILLDWRSVATPALLELRCACFSSMHCRK